MGVRWLAVMLIVACGRIGFAPTAGDGAAVITGDGAHDGTPVSDGGATDGSHPSDVGAAIDGPGPAACANATLVSPGIRAAETTCVADLLDGCGPAATKERIYKLVAPVSGSYQIEALDELDNNIMNSIGIINVACTSVGTCSGIFGTSLVAGEMIYFAVEASGGGCTNIRLSITAPP